MYFSCDISDTETVKSILMNFIYILFSYCLNPKLHKNKIINRKNNCFYDGKIKKIIKSSLAFNWLRFILIEIARKQ